MSMRITYTLKDYQLRETSKGRGVVTYHLVDKDGKNRKVSAIVKLGFRGKITAIHPLHKRESPLIDILKQTEINETIVVDFTEYNMKHPRNTNQPVAVAARNTSVSYEQKDLLINDMESITRKKGRLLQMLGLGLLVFMAIMSVKLSFFS